MIGSGLVLCLGAFDKSDDGEERKNMLLYLLFFSIGSVSIIVLL